MNATATVTSLSGVVAAVVAGVFAWLARRAQAHAPESVAGGYSKLVGDMRVQYEELMSRIERLEREREEQNRQIFVLTEQVHWLMDHIPDESMDAFQVRFPPERPLREER